MGSSDGEKAQHLTILTHTVTVPVTLASRSHTSASRHGGSVGGGGGDAGGGGAGVWTPSGTLETRAPLNTTHATLVLVQQVVVVMRDVVGWRCVVRVLVWGA